MKLHLLALALLCMPACGDGNNLSAGGPDAGGEGGAADPGAGGADAGEPGEPDPVLEEGPGGFDPAFEDSAEFVTRMPEPARGLASSPHEVVQIYYSSNLLPILGRETFGPLPAGSVAIKKQDRNDDAVIDQIMVMVKGPEGTDAELADWVFEQYDPESFELVSSSATSSSFRTSCSGCHLGFGETDWLAGTSLGQ